MEALNELCDIIEQNPKQFLDKLPWICQQCPQPKLLCAESPRVSQSHLNGVLAVTRILSRNLDTSQNDAKFVVLDFLQALRSSISAFYFSFLGYVSCLSLEFGTIVVELVMMSCCGETESEDRDQSISMAFLSAVSQHFPTIQQSDGDNLITVLLHQFPADELSIGYSKGSKDVFLHKVASFEDESIECLEKQEIAFKLVTNVLCKVKLDSQLYLLVRSIAKRQLQSMYAFLKSRRQDWNTQDPLLKTRVNAKLFVYQAAAQMEIEACFTSLWRSMKACKDLFISLLSGTAKIATAEAGQPLRLLLTRLKPLILAVCAQPDTSVSSQGNMFESVFKISCEIIVSGWAKDQASVNAFIVGLASSIRERYDYGEQDGREKQVPDVLLNVIQLLADISVAVKKPEVADKNFPSLIESLDECDVSSPHSLRLQLLEVVSRIASLGFEKSYRQTVVLMRRSYLSQISVESNTSAPESRSKHIETLPAGFLTIACGLMKTKLRADYRHRLLSLCSDVGLASESKSGGSGAEFLGPLLPAVAEICSDFDPNSNVEPSLIKLFRNLWFYIALFGLAPPILNTPLSEVKTTSKSVNSAGRISTFSLRAVLGPYMWNTQWALAVKRISQGSTPLVVSSAKWLEDEFELNLLHNSDSLRGTGNKKVASAQRTALSIVVGGRIDMSRNSIIQRLQMVA
ncbi:PREDICTED: phosphatidylinositol 4-kinase alpha 1-like isoform X2 [Camelina sativa]|uniref:Phosphatidylinositol 4-kinase alpha 1-like isoform X2 n=1 Tax=Camelina sativa TaxID=90675 RepID=A0ABM0YGU4_CAMSA|nr:PREDICTED: phosphatidylinositol 4-kinase alpha 1-like isoform X2 [Camelina sativa]